MYGFITAAGGGGAGAGGRELQMWVGEAGRGFNQLRQRRRQVLA